MPNNCPRKVVLLSLQAIALLLLVFSLSSCVSSLKNQSNVDVMASTSQYEQALAILNSNPRAYGGNNELLYLLDKGLIEHYNARYAESVETFAAAQAKFDEFYTKSVSKIGLTWLINDLAAPYRGEDFEYVFINIFQALNYLMLGKYEDALVEARDVDSKLGAVNNQYEADQKNVYKEDAFARLLMGIIYEAEKTPQDCNDAYISYVKAETIYEADYKNNYGVTMPGVLRENILTMARFMGIPEFGKYRDKFKNTGFFSLKEKEQKAEVYLIQYNGLCPQKVEDTLLLPLPDGHIVKIAFPRYQERGYSIASSRILAKNKQGEVFHANTEIGQRIGSIAVKNLERRKIRFIAKSTARAASRYLVEKKQTENIKKKKGTGVAAWFQFFSNIYNMLVERADTRSWQTLPDQIRIARLLLEPGEYELQLENFNAGGSLLCESNLGKVLVGAGQKRFMLVHTAR
ncbi:MAG: hypothetical protein KKH34_09520 [Candidatus Omnitrophica bacterium]|nr:hypothetical protein [Candidatus Omnitrophota bacterium]